MSFPSPIHSPTNTCFGECSPIENTQRLPPIHALLQQQDVLTDDIRRLSTTSTSSESADGRTPGTNWTLPPINELTPEPYNVAGRRLNQVTAHFHPYAPSPSSPRTGRLSRRGSPLSESEDSRNPKAIREKKARGIQIVEFSRLQRTLRDINPTLESEWTPLKPNNISDIDDPLCHNKIDVLVASNLMHQHQYDMLLDLVHFLHDEGYESKAREVTENMNTAGSRFDARTTSL